MSRFLPRFNRKAMASWLCRCNELFNQWPYWVTLEKLGILAGVTLFIFNVWINYGKKHDERIQKHLQAWQIVNLGRTGDWGGGADGRVEALESLVFDHVSLDGVDLTRAWLVGANLRGASLRGASLDRAIVDLVDLRFADLTGANLQVASARGLNVFGVEGVPPEVLRRLREMGAVELEGHGAWRAHKDGIRSEGVTWQE